MVGYIAATVPAKIDRVSGTTLFHVAMIEFNDALQWATLAQLNLLADPWIHNGQQNILIPPVLPAVLRDFPVLGGGPPPAPITPIPTPILTTARVPVGGNLVLSALHPTRTP